MNTAAVKYTPLECLLLFQSLVTYGTDDEAFVRISTLLTNNAFVKDGSTYDAGRLRSEPLRELYLQLLHDELKAEEDGRENGSQPGSKKRKAPGPTLPTIKDAEEHKDKLPILVDRLYARYRSSMIEAIREDERRYAVLQREVDEIERGEWDHRMLKEDQGVTNQNGILPPNANQAVVNGARSVPKSDGGRSLQAQPANHPPPNPSQPMDSRQDGPSTKDVLNGRDSARPSSPLVSDPKARPGPPPIQQRPGSNGPHGPSPLQPSPYQPPPIQQQHQPTQQQQQQQQQPGMAYKWEPPYGPPRPNPNQSSYYYPLVMPNFPVRVSPHNGSHGAQNPQFNTYTPSISGHRSPGLPLDALADAAGQQYRAPSGSPSMKPPPMHGSPMQPPSGAFAPPYLQGQQWTPAGSGQQRNGAYMPGYPAHNVPSQQYPTQAGSQGSFAHPSNSVPSENRQYNSPYNPNQGTRPLVQSIQKRPSLPGTPVSQGTARFMTGSGTRWTPNPSASTPRNPTLADRPTVEPISPILRPTKVTSTKKEGISKVPPKSKKPTQRRGTQRTRAGSTASSVLPGSYRSQSVASHADDLAVKEEVATPLPLPPGLDDEPGDTTADESLPNLRHRPSNIATSPSHLKRKRKDSVPDTPKPAAGPASHVLWTRNFPKISASALESVTSHRLGGTFAKPVKEAEAPGYQSLVLRPQDMKSIKSAITAGNRAATAAMPEDTPTAQTRVWLPISEDLIPPKGIINYAQLEKELMRMFANAVMFSADPDRGLGASWDEMRGRAKQASGGYEIDEDGVVKDAKAMFADIEQVVGNLRRAERRSEEYIGAPGMRLGSVVRGSSVGNRDSSIMEGEDEADEVAAEADESTGPTTKRRRKA